MYKIDGEQSIDQKKKNNKKTNPESVDDAAADNQPKLGLHHQTSHAQGHKTLRFLAFLLHGKQMTNNHK